jgi:hypothetical protein
LLCLYLLLFTEANIAKESGLCGVPSFSNVLFGGGIYSMAFLTLFTFLKIDLSDVFFVGVSS